MSRVKKMLAVTAQECYPGCNTPVIVPNMLVLKSQRLLMSIIIIKMRNFYSTFQTRGTILEYYTSTVNCPIIKLDLHHVTSEFITELPPITLFELEYNARVYSPLQRRIHLRKYHARKPRRGCQIKKYRGLS